MISELISQVMQQCKLKQKDLAVVLDVPLQRVKRLTGGEVKKFAPDEIRRLVQTLNLSAHWLATGEGPMFDAKGGQALGERLSQLRLCSAAVAGMGLTGDTANAVRDIAYGVAIADAEVVATGIKLLQPDPPSDEQLLLDSYRRCSIDAKRNLIQSAALLSAGMAPAAAPMTGRGHTSGGLSQQATGNNNVQFGTVGTAPRRRSG